MAKKSAIQKNLNKEKQVKKNKSRRERLKAICNNRSISMEERFEAQLKLSEMPNFLVKSSSVKFNYDQLHMKGNYYE